MSLTELKYEIANKRIQQIEVSENGTVLESDQAFFELIVGDSIGSFHPFFEGVQYLLPEVEESLSFPCINIEKSDAKKIVDIVIVKRAGSIYILIFDFTKHYEAAHPLVQEKNETSIAKNKLDFEKRLLQAKEIFKNNFLSNVNHEIRNPLNNMLGFMELLGETKLDYEQLETLKAIKKTGMHIKVLMDDMLDISKIERGLLERKHVNFHLGSIISNLKSHFDLKYASGKVVLELEVQDHMLKTYKGDPIRLNQILYNLVENAFKYTHKGTVTLKMFSEDREDNYAGITFIVEDTGKGIPKQEINTIFSSYHQLSVDKARPIGDGLGLKIVKELVDLLDGTIEVSSEIGKGSAFTCILPFEKRKSVREKKTVKKGTGVFQSKKLLILEDDASNQMLFMKLFLNNEKGYVIELAESAAQANMLLNKKKYDLIILKKELPDVVGLEFMEHLINHTKEEIAATPILMASGSTLLTEQQEFLNAGATEFLAKPYTKKELFNVIEKLIR